jgi:hypothetical protein
MKLLLYVVLVEFIYSTDLYISADGSSESNCTQELPCTFLRAWSLYDLERFVYLMS